MPDFSRQLCLRQVFISKLPLEESIYVLLLALLSPQLLLQTVYLFSQLVVSVDVLLHNFVLHFVQVRLKLCHISLAFSNQFLAL